MSELVMARIESFLWQPPAGFANGAGRYLLPVLRVLYCVIRDVAAGQLTLRAMSLVYTTLLSIVPLIAFSFSVLKGFGFHRQAEPLLYNFFQPLGEKGVELTNQIIAFVDNVSGRLLGGVGLLLLIYTVVSMVQKVESSFNYIWHVDQARSLARRFSDYLSVILVGPVVMVATMGLIGTISSHAIVQRLSQVEPLGTTLLIAGKLAPVLLLTLLFSFVYVFITNTRVKITAALTGAITAGFLWALGGKLFASFVVGSTKYAAIYTSFAVVIIALIWLYVSWLILLVGSQIAFYVQHPEYMRIGQRRIAALGRQRDAMGLELMLTVGESFLSGTPEDDVNEIASAIGVPGDTLGPVSDCLQHAGLLTITEEGALIPGRDLATIRLYDIFEALRRAPRGVALPPGHTEPRVDSLLDELNSAVREKLDDRTLRDLLVEEDASLPAPPPSDEASGQTPEPAPELASR
jgi:membrane protein